MNSATANPAVAEAHRLADAVRHHVRYTLGRTLADCSSADMFRALALPIRERLIDGLLRTEARYRAAPTKRLYFLSAEYLVGQSLRHNLLHLGLFDVARAACEQLGVDLDAVLAAEPDAALGNGGLGRLAMCLLESMASLAFPGFGYGINYEFGLFKQALHDGAQQERPDQWHPEDSPWLIPRSDQACFVPMYGHIETVPGSEDRPSWTGWQVLVGVPHDMPIPGAAGSTVNWLRLYSARASDEFDVQIFNSGDYIQAVQRKIASETVSKVLYPSDSVASGKELRLQQEYFMIACAMRDILRRLEQEGHSVEDLPDCVAIQMNDTHPSLAVAELMRLLVDEYALPWERAWDVTQATCAYTNHTLLPEALEKWPVPLFERLLPRHLQIIYEINQRFLDDVRVHWVGDSTRVQRMSLVEEYPERQVRMAHLAMVGSHAVNGVAKLHTELVKTTLAPDFAELWPARFQNKTNGVNHRRWLVDANPALADLISQCIGREWVDESDRLREFAREAMDPVTQGRFAEIKRENKRQLAKVIRAATGVNVDPDSLFDVHVKRIHEYKRQLLNAMHVIHRYLQIVEDGVRPSVPRTVIFSGKAAPGYTMAKLVIRLVNGIAEAINSDPRANEALRVVFLPDYRVSLAERIMPAADLSEQISTAGTEASGTGNMKLAMNGAITIGTFDGANIEICDEVGDENIYIFGLRAADVQARRESGAYSPWDYYGESETVRRVMDALCGNLFCPSHPGLFRALHDSILYGGDRYMILPDFEPYLATHDRIVADVADESAWRQKGILNVAAMARFSTDRTVREYAREIWGIAPVSPDAGIA